MVSTTVLANLFLASAALAGSSLEATHKYQRAADHQSHTARYLKNVRDVTAHGGWAGAIHKDAAGTWSVVSARFTVPAIPTVPLPINGAIATSAWVGIDGSTCVSAAFATGVELVNIGGTVTFTGFSQWSSNLHRFSNITFEVGDVVVLTTSVSSPTAGTAKIENLTRGQTVTNEVTSRDALCQQDASWVVKTLGSDPLANFGAINFSNAFARTDHDYQMYPNTSSIINISGTGGRVCTSTAADASNVNVTYVPSAVMELYCNIT